MEQLYTLAIKFKEYDNVIFLYSKVFDSKVVETKLAVKNPISSKPVVVTFAGASTRRQRLYRYREMTKNGQILGG